MKQLHALALLLAAACGTAGDDAATSSGALPPDALVLADGVQVDGVSLFQGTEVELMRDGAAIDPASQVPIVAGRNAMLRVFVSSDAAYDRNPIVARLSISDEQLELNGTITSKSSQYSLSSTFNFDIDGELLTGATSWQVELLQTYAQSSGNNQNATSGTMPLSPPVPGRTLKLMLLPIIYSADGSDRAPDTSEAQLALYREAFLATYPVADVEVSLGDAVTTQTHLDPEGAGWDELLDEMLVLRNERQLPEDTYLYGLIAPADSQQDYCEFGCILGNSYLNDSGAADLRASIGLGFSGPEAISIAVHELGHQHGRPHAPCEVPDPDPAYPYADGKIGRWGYDPRTRSLLSPDNTADLMGYCTPAWVSDYTFRALLERLTLVSALGSGTDETPRQRYQMMRMAEDGRMKRGPELSLPRLPESQLSSHHGILDGRSVRLRGHFTAYSHVPGGVLLLP